MLELRNINLKLKDFELKDISLKIEKGEYHMLVGPSGSGKTLMLNIIAGFVKANSGQVLLNEKDITGFVPQLRNVSYLFQDLALFPNMSVAENVAFPLVVRHMNKQDIEEKVKKYLEFAEVYHLKDRGVSKLSGGEKQRVALARNLITESGILMLDEPFSAIDTQLKLSLKKLLKKISDIGVTIIHVTHNPEEVLNLADKITVVEDGKIVGSGNFNEVFHTPVNKFMAGFTGNRNYFYCSGVLNEDGITYILASEEKNCSRTVKIEVSDSVTTNTNSIIIDSNNIVISENRLSSSARNNFEGEIIAVLRSENSWEIEIDFGLSVWVKITEQSFVDLKIAVGKRVWISFKASAVKLM